MTKITPSVLRLGTSTGAEIYANMSEPLKDDSQSLTGKFTFLQADCDDTAHAMDPHTGGNMQHPASTDAPIALGVLAKLD